MLGYQPIHGLQILTIFQCCHGHGKVMDFLEFRFLFGGGGEFLENSWNFTNKLNFEIRSWKNHGILSQQFMSRK